ncbi:hypothetical protein [Fictibacillus sp. FJAT-27399]|uniref:hypothetical protein n=1 Tax=Fictibacillus sp. FJAT-27399 TaxID=1729689 RepID=UPI0007837540|nr:hypothetical protein [Fictibacillus sp. FJAT-27399]
MLKRKYALIYAIGFCLLLTGCNSHTNAVEHPKTKKVVNKNEKLNLQTEKEAFKKITTSYNKKDYVQTIRDVQVKYGDLISKENKKRVSTIYYSSVSNLLELGNVVVVEALLSQSKPYLELLNRKTLEKVNDYKNQNEKKAQFSLEDQINEIVSYIKEGNYLEVIDYENQKIAENETVSTLIHFAKAREIMEDYNDPDYYGFKENLGWIDPKYNGVLSSEIKNYIGKYMTHKQWEEQFDTERELEAIQESQEKEAEEKAKEEAAKPLPTIGMTKKEVLNSKWGQPTDVNKTTTANSVTEQWVYPGYKYLYFEDGVLTAIQE